MVSVAPTHTAEATGTLTAAARRGVTVDPVPTETQEREQRGNSFAGAESALRIWEPCWGKDRQTEIEKEG